MKRSGVFEPRINNETAGLKQVIDSKQHSKMNNVIITGLYVSCVRECMHIFLPNNSLLMIPFLRSKVQLPLCDGEVSADF